MDICSKFGGNSKGISGNPEEKFGGNSKGISGNPWEIPHRPIGWKTLGVYRVKAVEMHFRVKKKIC